MSQSFSSQGVDLDAFKAKADSILENIMTNEDPKEIAEYRQAFKRSVGFFHRSLVAAYLFKVMMKGEGPSLPRKPMGQTTSLFVSIGKNRRVFPRDLIGFFASKGDIQKQQIGDIKILDSYSFVEIESSVADLAISKLDGQDFRGRKLTVNHAKKRSE